MKRFLYDLAWSLSSKLFILGRDRRMNWLQSFAEGLHNELSIMPPNWTGEPDWGPDDIGLVAPTGHDNFYPYCTNQA